MEFEFMSADTVLPPCMPLPAAMLRLPISSTAKAVSYTHLDVYKRQPPDTAHKRIYDRVTEMCTPVCCSGVNFRREKAQEKMERLKKLMND